MQVALLEGVSTPPGRVQTFLSEPHKGTTPHSCTLIVYKNDIWDLLQFCSKSLRWGAGVKVILDDYADPTPVDFTWGFYLSPDHPDYNLLAADQRHYLVDDFGSSTVITVADSMEESTPSAVSIEESWKVFIEAAVRGDRIVVDLSNLRPSGTENDKGLVSTGPIGKGKKDDPDAGSFFAIYRDLAKHLGNADIGSLLQLLGTINDTLRRGGAYKGGIITSAMYWRNPHFSEYLAVPVTSLAGGHKKGVRVCPAILGNKPLLKDIARSATEEGTFLGKVQSGHVFDNVCVTADTWINTSDGPRQVAELVGKPFMAVVDGNKYASTEEGFWSNGVKKVFRLSTVDGYQLRLTPDHKVLRATRRHYRDPYVYEWTASGNLKPGDKIKLNNCRVNPEWSGSGNREEGWLIGYLVGNGSIGVSRHGKTIAQMPFWGEHRYQMLEKTKALIDENAQTYRQGGNVPYTRTGCSRLRHDRNQEQVTVSSTGVARLAERFGVVKESKAPADLVERASSDFCKGFVQGIFDADAHVSLGQATGSGRAIQFTQVNTDTVFLIQRILLRFGIKTAIYKRPSKGIRQFPDGAYQTRDALRLDITGATNIQQYASLIGFTKPDKVDSLNVLLQSYKRTQYREDFLAVVESIEEDGEEEVFDCTIHDIHCFDANGIIAHNCMGLMLPDRGTCLIWRLNIALCRTFEEIAPAMCKVTEELCNLHASWRKQVGDRANLFAPLEQDRQIGVDILGLANALAYWGITYMDLTLAIERFIEGRHGGTEADRLVFHLADAYRKSTILADEFMRERGLPLLERIHTIEPSQNHAYHCKDLRGFTTARSIFAPFGQKVRRVSNSQRNMVVRHGAVETAADVGPTLHQHFCEQWQALMELCGRAHSISFDSWEPITPDWIEDWMASPLLTKYYTEHTRYNQEFLRKQAIAVCDVSRPGECLACAD